MRAIVQDEYGAPDVLELREVDRPEVGDEDVLVRVHAASVNHADWEILRGALSVIRIAFGVRRPRNPVRGTDVAGTVVAVGERVEGFQPGDEVFGEGRGTFAEHACARHTVLAIKPAGLSFVEAAAIPMAGVTALQGVRDVGKVQPGDKVLINPFTTQPPSPIYASGDRLRAHHRDRGTQRGVRRLRAHRARRCRGDSEQHRRA